MLPNIDEIKQITEASRFNEDLYKRKLAEECLNDDFLASTMLNAAKIGKDRILYFIPKKYQEAAEI